jgi:hypothetical protein
MSARSRRALPLPLHEQATRYLSDPLVALRKFVNC